MKQALRTSVVPKERVEAVVRHEPEDRFVGPESLHFRKINHPMFPPFVEPTFAANENRHIETGVPPSQNPIAGRKFLRRKIIDGVVIHPGNELPTFRLRIPAIGPQLQFLVRPESALPTIMCRKRQQLPVTHPEPAGNECVGFVGHAGDRPCIAPGDSIVARGELDLLRWPVFDLWAVTPDAPELVVVMDQVVVQLQPHPIHLQFFTHLKIRRQRHRIDHRVGALQPRQRLIINRCRIRSGLRQIQNRQRVGCNQRGREKDQREGRDLGHRTVFRSFWIPGQRFP